jgi:hypothetical protein
VPKGARGERRPADVIGCAVTVARLSVGLETEEKPTKPSGKVRSGHAWRESAGRDPNAGAAS